MLSIDSALLSIALGIDAAMVAFAIGLAHPDKSHAPGLRLAFWFGGFQFLMSALGFLVTDQLSFLRQFADKGAGVVFILLGVKLIWDAWHESEEVSVPTTHHAHLLLAVATSIDALAAGFGLVTSSHPWSTILLIGLVAFLMTWVGARLSRVVSHLPEKYLALGGGGILFFLGAKNFL